MLEANPFVAFLSFLGGCGVCGCGGGCRGSPPLTFLLSRSPASQGDTAVNVSFPVLLRQVRRNLLARPRAAEYLGEFTADVTDSGFTKGTQWLVWNFESDSTLADALENRLGKFPEAGAALFCTPASSAPLDLPCRWKPVPSSCPTVCRGWQISCCGGGASPTRSGGTCW